jgi:hypothetical protein
MTIERKTVVPVIWTGTGYRFGKPRLRARLRPVEPDPGEGNGDMENLPVFTPPVDATGTTEVATALTEWIKTVPDGSIIRLAENGIYRVDDASVVVENRQDLRFEFNGAKMIRTRLIDQHLRYPQRHGILKILSCTNIEIWQPHLEGVVYDAWLDPVTGDRHPYRILDRRGDERSLTAAARSDGLYSVALEFEHGLDIDRGANVTVYGGFVSGVGGDGVFIRGIGHRLLPMPGTALTPGCGMVVDRNGRQGIAHTSGADCKIIGVDVVGSRRGCINMEPLPNGVVNGVELAYCKVRGNGLGITSSGGGQVNNAWVHHIEFGDTGTPSLHNGSKHWDTMIRRHNWLVEHCTGKVGGSSAPGLRFHRIDNVIVRNNSLTFPSSREMTGCEFIECTGWEFYGNDFHRATTKMAVKEMLVDEDGVPILNEKGDWQYYTTYTE